jgi:hypothetical protein
MNLHASYHPIRTTILSHKEEPSLSEIKGILTGASSSVTAIKSEPLDIALATRAPWASRKPTNSTSSSCPTSSSRPTSSSGHGRDEKGFRWCDPTNEGHCHRCGRSGHIAARCIYDMPQQIKDWVMRVPGSSGSFQDTAHHSSADAAFGASYSTHQFDHPSSHPSTPPFCIILPNDGGNERPPLFT